MLKSSRLYIGGAVSRFISRLKHKRGHGVHSPYIYNLVRGALMRRGEYRSTDMALYKSLIGIGVKSRYAEELENIRHHCGVSSFAIDELQGEEMLICSTSLPLNMIEEFTLQATGCGTTVVILSPHTSRSREDMCARIISSHRSTTILRRGYLVIFNNHLPKQHFIL